MVDTDDELVQRAMHVLESRLRRDGGDPLTSPSAVRDYLRVRIGRLEHEVFIVLFLDSQHRLVAVEELFRKLPSTHDR
jgi:DNA repair protein RadC